MIIAFGGAGGVVSAVKRCVGKGSLLLLSKLNRDQSEMLIFE
jgi:hypothetical protein